MSPSHAGKPAGPSGGRGQDSDAESQIPSEDWPGATAEELAQLSALPAKGQWEVGGQTLALTNLDKEIFPPREDVDEPPVTKRDLVAYFARIAPAMLPHLAGPAAEPPPVPERRRGGRVLAEGHPQERSVVADDLGGDRRPGRASAGQHASGRRRRGNPVLARQSDGLRGACLDLDVHRSVAPHVRPDRHRPGSGDRVGGDAHAGAAVPHRAGASRGAGLCQDDRFARHPGVDPGRARALQLRGDLGVGGGAVPGGGRDRAGPGELGVGDEAARGQGAPGLHAERADQDARRALRGASAGGGAGLDADHLGRAG